MNFESRPELGDAKERQRKREKNCFKRWSFPGTGLDKAEKSQGLSFPVHC